MAFPLRLLTLIPLFMLGGCGGPKGPEVTTVEGVVKINNKPASNLLIQFHPIKWPENMPVVSATAVSDESGRFQLTSSDGRPGAPLGKHKVTIVDKSLETDDEPGAKVKFTQNRVPSTYASVTRTPIEMTVETGKKEYDLAVAGR